METLCELCVKLCDFAVKIRNTDWRNFYNFYNFLDWGVSSGLLSSSG
jgi:hypothetical protein